MINKQNERSYFGPRSVRSIKVKDAEKLAREYKELARIGITFDSAYMAEIQTWLNKMSGVGFDADLFGTIATTPSITTPIQFLQSWLPGFVEDMTAPRKIDELIGIATQGTWADEEIVQGVLERTGNAVPYGDYTNVPMSSWNVNYVRRTIVRFEEGLQVGKLEEQRAAAIRINSADAKRAAASRALEIERNRVGFYGYNAGANRTYGFLNDPNLPAYVNVANGGGGNPQWSTKTYLEIVADLLTAFAAIRTQSKGIIDPKSTPLTLAIANDAIDYLSTVSQYGKSVNEWLKENYPNVRTMSAPELDDAGAANAGVFYLYAETVDGSGSDDNRTWIQVVPQKFFTLGVEPKVKSYKEDFSNATAGTMLKRPFAVYRASGIS